MLRNSGCTGYRGMVAEPNVAGMAVE